MSSGQLSMQVMMISHVQIHVHGELTQCEVELVRKTLTLESVAGGGPHLGLGVLQQAGKGMHQIGFCQLCPHGRLKLWTHQLGITHTHIHTHTHTSHSTLPTPMQTHR